MSATTCMHHHYGHCKYGERCRNVHITETCDSSLCIMTTCHKRHPKVCRYYSISGSCKFQETCSYLHKHEQNEKKELVKEIENLKEDINVLTIKVDKLKEALTSLSKVYIQACMFFKSTQIKCMPENSFLNQQNSFLDQLHCNCFIFVPKNIP